MSKTYKEFITEFAMLHKMFRNVDIKSAKKIHAKLIKNVVIPQKHKFGDIIKVSEIDKYHAHTDGFSHDFRGDIDAYNDVVKRDKDYI